MDTRQQKLLATWKETSKLRNRILIALAKECNRIGFLEELTRYDIVLATRLYRQVKQCSLKEAHDWAKQTRDLPDNPRSRVSADGWGC